MAGLLGLHQREVGVFVATQQNVATEHYSEITGMFRRGYKGAKRQK